MIQIESFGITKNAKQAHRYTMKNTNGISVEVSDFGALVLKICVPDHNGIIRDVVLGFDRPEDYYNIGTGMGAYIGRNANRISGAAVTIDGVEYILDNNDKGNNLHSGYNRSHIHMYKTEMCEGDKEDYIQFSRMSPDSCNHPEFPNSILQAGKVFKSKTIYQFNN